MQENIKYWFQSHNFVLKFISELQVDSGGSSGPI